MKHASTLAFPEVEADAFDNICGALGRSHEDLEDDLDKVTCPDCLRAIAEWGQRQGQAACGLAFDAGRTIVRRERQLTSTVNDLGRTLLAGAAVSGEIQIGPYLFKRVGKVGRPNG